MVMGVWGDGSLSNLTKTKVTVVLDPLGPTAEEARFLHGIPEPRRKAWEKIFRDEKIQEEKAGTDVKTNKI